MVFYCLLSVYFWMINWTPAIKWWSTWETVLTKSNIFQSQLFQLKHLFFVPSLSWQVHFYLLMMIVGSSPTTSSSLLQKWPNKAAHFHIGQDTTFWWRFLRHRCKPRIEDNVIPLGNSLRYFNLIGYWACVTCPHVTQL